MTENFMMNVQRTRSAILFKHLLTYGITEAQEIVALLKQKSYMTTQSRFNLVYDKLTEFKYQDHHGTNDFHTLVHEFVSFYELGHLEKMIDLLDRKWYPNEPVPVTPEKTAEVFRDPNN